MSFPIETSILKLAQEVQNTAGEAASETKLLGDQPIPPVGKPLWLAEAQHGSSMLLSLILALKIATTFHLEASNGFQSCQCGSKFGYWFRMNVVERDDCDALDTSCL